MSVLDAVAEVVSFLDEGDFPYAVIGGIAVQYWGEARTTRDVDIMVMVPAEREQELIEAAVQCFRPRISDAAEFARQNRVLLLSTSNGTPVDITLGIAGYEEEVIHRTVKVSLIGRSSVCLISAEDLIIHKCIAGRPRDIEDIERILVRQCLNLDLAYIREWIQAFAPIVEDHDVVALFEDALAKAQAAVEAR